jgi:rhomboid protease GluP
MDVEVRHHGTTAEMDWSAFEDEVRRGRVQADAELRCSPITGDRWVRAGDLEVWQGLACTPDAALLRAIESRRVPWLSLAVGLALVLMWIPSHAPDGSAWLVARFGVLAPAILEQGEAWRLLTAVLVHVGFVHIAGNLAFLLWSGPWLERAWGRGDLALLLVVSALAASATSALAWPDRASVGASGMACGVLGAAAVFGWRHAAAVPHKLRIHFGTCAFLLLALALGSGLRTPEVELWGHLAGACTGALAGLLLGPGRRAVRIGLLVAAVTVLAVPTALGPRLAPLEPWTADGVACEAPALWREAATGGRLVAPGADAATLTLTTRASGSEAGVEAAASALLVRIRSQMPGVVVREWSVGRVDGAPAIDLTLGGTPSDPVVHAVVIARGVYVHTLALEAEGGARRAALWRRIRASVRLAEPAAVGEARAAVANSPRAAEAWRLLALALATAGDPRGARQAQERAEALPGP